MAKKALIVDNDFFYTEFLGDLLEKRGYQVVKAYDGKEGILKLEEGPFDILFVDLVMPKIDGYAFISLVRKRFPRRSFPIVLVSATLVEQMGQIQEQAADFYVAKGPVEGMAERIEEILQEVETRAWRPTGQGSFMESGRIYPRQITAELLEIVRRYEAILASLGVGVVVVDKDARIIHANPLALEMTGRSLEGLLGGKVTDLLDSSKQQSAMVRALKSVVKNPEPGRTGFDISAYDRRIRVIVSLLWNEGKMEGWTVTLVEMHPWAGQA